MPRLVQELKDALQQQQVTEQAAACVGEQAQTARRHQQEHAEENAALKHEIQVELNLILLVPLCGRGRELTNNSRIAQRRTACTSQASHADRDLYTVHIGDLSASAHSITLVHRLFSTLQLVHTERCELTLSVKYTPLFGWPLILQWSPYACRQLLKTWKPW